MFSPRVESLRPKSKLGKPTREKERSGHKMTDIFLYKTLFGRQEEVRVSVLRTGRPHLHWKVWYYKIRWVSREPLGLYGELATLGGPILSDTDWSLPGLPSVTRPFTKPLSVYFFELLDGTLDLPGRPVRERLFFSNLPSLLWVQDLVKTL